MIQSKDFLKEYGQYFTTFYNRMPLNLKIKTINGTNIVNQCIFEHQ